ncbi:MAG: protein translocase subunit SecD [Coriobacteriia bacterium]|nr:protein translocase subunit SecD [Coriobacteriia bacterium]MBN2847892.1 protein translocase subunit SecD [Coriobacteriia bacterium]
MDPKTRNALALVVIVTLVGLALWQALPLDAKITQGLDIKGGLSVILTAEPLGTAPLTEDAIERVETILVERVNGFGVSEATVQRQGANAFLIQLPGVRDAREALDLLGKPGKLEFVELASITDTATLDLATRQIEVDRSGDTTDLPKLDGSMYEPFMTGEVITAAQVTTDQFNNAAVSISMSKEGSDLWADVTTRLYPTRGQILIVLDGLAKSAPAVQEPILTGDTQITGSFTFDEAKRLAAVLQSGALPVEISIDESRVVGPTLGQDSLRQGLLAALLGLGLVAVFMAVYYRGLGVISWFSLLIFASIFLGVLALLSRLGAFALSLPGIAGMVLTIGLAADSSILQFERFKEEVRLGKTFRSAAKSGTRHAIGTSIDADVVTLVSAAAIYLFAIGPVRGFALTLMIGILIDIVVMTLFTRTAIVLLAESVIAKAPALFGMKGGDQRA